MNQILLFNETIHPRLQYVVSVLQSYITATSFRITTSIEEFTVYPGPSINYSRTSIKSNEYFIKESGNLYHPLEQLTDPIIRKSEQYFQIFPDLESDRFDLFAAVFYLLARVEEYQLHEIDKHHRFNASSSILAKQGVLQQAVVDEWIFNFLKALEITFNISLPIRKYKPEWSIGIDIDQFYKHKYKSTGIKLAGTLRDFAYGKYNAYLERIQIYCGLIKDPYDSTIHFLHTPIAKEQLTFFVLSGGNSSYDKNHSLKLKPVLQTLDFLKTIGTIGLHPSYNTMDASLKIKIEKQNLETACGIPIKSSRQHFLRLQVDKTYPALIENNILIDYSLGFADQTGFRAGTCRPFYWYDLKNEMQSNLKLIPISCMDRTYLDYLKYSPEQAKESIIQLFELVKKYGGQFHLIWHNSSFDFKGEWTGWDHVFDDIIDYFNKRTETT
ncbi:MAG: polysaccharide deacetylase family protein [Saprospiraceae bacterium]